MKKLLFILVILCLQSCAPRIVTRAIAIDARSQKIAVQSLTGLSRSIPESLLPEGEWDRQILQTQLDEVRIRLIAELHRGERFGQYTLVDSAEPATIEIAMDLLDVGISGDTITFPFQITVTNTMYGTTITETISSVGICEKTPEGATGSRAKIQRCGSALMDNARHFPVEQIAGWFYPTGQKILEK